MSQCVKPNVRALATRVIASIDSLVSDQLDAILHHPRFQALESSWRGLQLLVSDTPKNRRTRIAMLNVTWAEVCRDMERSLEWDQSLLFWKLHTSEFDMPGGEPYGILICNFDISHKNAVDIRTLRKMSAVAEASFCTLVFAGKAELFGLDSFSEMHPSLTQQQLFREPQYQLWNSLRKDTSSRFLAFILPRVLLRKPWSLYGARRGRFPFQEHCEKHDDFLWGHPGFVLARVLLREFEEVGWFAHIRGAPRDTLAGGIVTQILPEIAVDKADDTVSIMPTCELAITDNMERNLSECGLITLVQCWQTPFNAFYSLPSLYSPRRTDDQQVDQNERIASQVQNVLCASRFAHYIKVIMREKIGSFTTAEECQKFIHEWLREYSVGGEEIPWSTKARYPLRKFKVDVREKPASPGHFLCDVMLMPHYQYDGLVGEVKLTTELGGPKQ